MYNKVFIYTYIYIGYYKYSDSASTRIPPLRQHDELTIFQNLQYYPELLYDWRFTANQFVLATSPLRLTTINFFSTEPLRSLSLRNIHSEERTGLSFKIVAGPRQRNHSQVRVPRNS
jgi:hypothetical protein